MAWIQAVVAVALLVETAKIVRLFLQVVVHLVVAPVVLFLFLVVLKE